MFATCFTSLSVLLLFPLLITFFLCTVFDSIPSKIDEVLSINPSVNVFVFGDFNVHHKNWFTYSGDTDRSGEVCYNFSISFYNFSRLLAGFGILVFFTNLSSMGMVLDLLFSVVDGFRWF